MVQSTLESAIKSVMSQREEIPRAFIAKHGFEPDRAVQVEQRNRDGTTCWFVRRMTDHEIFARRILPNPEDEAP